MGHFIQQLRRVETVNEAIRSRFLPKDVTDLIDVFCGGTKELPCRESIELDSERSLKFQHKWLKPCDPRASKSDWLYAFDSQLETLLHMEYCRAEMCMGNLKFEIVGFLNPVDNSLLSKNFPYMLGLKAQKVVLHRSSSEWNVKNILKNPCDYNRYILEELLKVVYSDLMEWLAELMSKPECVYPEERMLEFIGDCLGVNCHALGEPSEQQCHALKEHRVGKFHRKKKHSRLKKRRKEKIGSERERKCRKTKAKPRVHKKRLSY